MNDAEQRLNWANAVDPWPAAIVFLFFAVFLFLAALAASEPPVARQAEPGVMAELLAEHTDDGDFIVANDGFVHAVYRAYRNDGGEAVRAQLITHGEAVSSNTNEILEVWADRALLLVKEGSKVHQELVSAFLHRRELTVSEIEEYHGRDGVYAPASVPVPAK